MQKAVTAVHLGREVGIKKPKSIILFHFPSQVDLIRQAIKVKSTILIIAKNFTVHFGYNYIGSKSMQNNISI